MPLGYTQVPTSKLDYLYRRVYRIASRYSTIPQQFANHDAIEGFKRAQRLAYDAVEYVASQLYVGITEQEAANLLEAYLRAYGSERYLHRAFAWFGEHSRFDGYASYGDYHPSNKRLGSDDVAILDVSPIVDGYIGDVGYTVSLQENPQLAQAKAFLRELRAEIPTLFASDQTPADIWAMINQKITQAGYDTVHDKYPHCVLGHRVFRVKPQQGKPLRLGWGGFGWFSLETNLAFLKMGPSAALGPEHIGNKLGLWAIEPHIGWQGGGAKFEEILVVEANRCYWLDDNVPHMREELRK